MSLRKLTTAIAPLVGVALLIAVSSAQAVDTSTAPKDAASDATSPSGAMALRHKATAVRPTAKAHAAGMEKGSGQAAKVANEQK